MSIRTTCIGAFPKPDYIEIGNFTETEKQDRARPALSPTPTTAPDCSLTMLGRAQVTYYRHSR